MKKSKCYPDRIEAVRQQGFYFRNSSGIPAARVFKAFISSGTIGIVKFFWSVNDNPPVMPSLSIHSENPGRQD